MTAAPIVAPNSASWGVWSFAAPLFAPAKQKAVARRPKRFALRSGAAGSGAAGVRFAVLGSLAHGWHRRETRSNESWSPCELEAAGSSHPRNHRRVPMRIDAALVVLATALSLSAAEVPIEPPMGAPFVCPTSKPLPTLRSPWLRLIPREVPGVSFRTELVFPFEGGCHPSAAANSPKVVRALRALPLWVLRRCKAVRDRFRAVRQYPRSQRPSPG